MGASETVTRGVRVKVESSFLPARSSPKRGRWVFSYTITIANEGTEPVQLLERHWIITDSDGDVQEVRGPGVVGKQPKLDPGASFRYTSFCPLPTSFGTMHGTYRMADASGGTFDARIAPFSLHEPYAIN